MIPHRLRSRPQLQRLRGIGIAFQFPPIDEPVRGRHMPFLQHGQSVAGYLRPRHTRRQIPVQRQIIERDRNLLCG